MLKLMEMEIFTILQIFCLSVPLHKIELFVHLSKTKE